MNVNLSRLFPRRIAMGKAIGLLMLSSLGLAPSVSIAAEPPKRLVFEAYVENNWELLQLDLASGETTNLTQTPDLHELYPQVSPDGQSICFLCDEIRDGETIRCVDLMKMDGSDRKRLAEKVREPAWSPDGSFIVFAPQEFSRFNILDYVSKGLLVYDVASGETRTAKNEQIHHIYNPNVSPDGKWLVSTVHGGMGFGHAIVAIEIDGDRVVDLEVSGCRPTLNADGSRMTWSSDDHTINVADLSWSNDGPSLSNSRVQHHEEEMHTYHPELSPDGRYVVFSLGPGGRVPANGPGTHTQVAEMIGVRGQWTLWLKEVDSDEPARQLTHGDDSTSKEADFVPDASGSSQ